MYGGAAPPRTGAHHASIAPYGPYATREGGPVYLAIQNAREWDALLRRECCGSPSWPTTSGSGRTRRACAIGRRSTQSLPMCSDELTAGRTVNAARRRPASPTLGLAILATFPIIRNSRAAIAGATSIRRPAPLRALLPPVEMTDVDPVDGRRSGARPAHRADSLPELGFDADAIAKWRREGTI